MTLARWLASLLPAADCDLDEVGTGIACLPLGLGQVFLNVLVVVLFFTLLGTLAGCWLAVAKGKHAAAKATARTMAVHLIIAGPPLLLVAFLLSLALSSIVALYAGLIGIPAVCAATARWWVLNPTPYSFEAETSSPAT